ncbi:MAG TPA: response regulator [Paludibacter sp.]|nr:response regulator [Paludibacter sp.]
MNLGTNRIEQAKFYDKGSKKEVRIDRNISTIFEDKKQQLYVGTGETGLLKYDRQKNTFVPLLLETSEKKEIKNYSVDAAAIDDKNRLFVAIGGYGLCILNDYGKLIVLNSTVQGVNSICYNNGLYVGGLNGLYLYNEEKNLYEHPIQISEVKGVVHHLFSDNKGILWIATETNGIVLYNPQTKEVDHINSGYGNEFLSSSSIYYIFQDRQKEFWIGTMRGGVDHWNPNRPQFHSIQNQLGNATSLNVVNTFVEIDKNTIWTGTDGSGIQQFDRQKNRFTESVELKKLNQVSGKAIIRMIKDRDDNVWICSYGWGITKYNLKTKRIDHYDRTNSNLKSDYLWSIFQDKRGTIWIGSLSNAYLMHYDKLKNTFIVDVDFLGGGVITISETSDRKLLIGTFRGAFIYDPNARRFQKLDDRRIASMHQDKNTNIWLGTDEDGLKIFNVRTGVIADFDSQKSFIKNEHIMSILEDDRYNIWITTNNGLYCYNYKTGQKASYDKSDGLQSNQFTNCSALKTSDGVFFWGGINGITILNPAKYNAQKQDFNLVLLDVKIMNKSVEGNSGKYLFPSNISEVKKIVVPYNEAYIGFDFIAISYPNSGKIEYAYFLEGVDKDWNYVGNNRSAYYSKLKEGEYIFRVKNTDNTGKWSDKQLVIKVKILPPFYRTWWAYLLYLILTTLSIRGILKAQSKQNQLKQNLLMAELKEQQNLELIQMKDQFFTNISHELRTPLTLIIPPLKDALSQVPFIPLKKTELTSIFSNASRLLSLINQLLLFRKNEVANSKLYISEADIVEFSKGVFDHFSLMANRREIKYIFDSVIEKIPFLFDKNKMEIILYNLLSNAFKFTKSKGCIKLSISKSDEGILAIQISDTGEGLTKTEVEKIFTQFYSSDRKSGIGIGLSLVNNYVTSHHGTIKVESEYQQGTSFTLNFPINANYETREFERIDFQEYSASEEIEELMELDVEIQEEEDTHIVEPDQFSSDSPSILIVEDNVEIRKYIRNILYKNNWQNILEADNGRRGLMLAREYSPDIIISDVYMEQMDGKELCRQIKNDVETSHIYVILITADTSESVEEKGLACGADEFLTKPFDRAKLLNKIRTLFSYRNHLRQYAKDKLTFHTQPEEVVSDMDTIFIDQCISLVKARYSDESFTVHEFAQSMNMSHSALYKKIKICTGKSINEFIRTIKISIAAELILKGDLSLNNIIAEVGIYDMKYFRECFKKEFGISPRDYKKMNQQQ